MFKNQRFRHAMFSYSHSLGDATVVLAIRTDVHVVVAVSSYASIEPQYMNIIEKMKTSVLKGVHDHITLG